MAKGYSEMTCAELSRQAAFEYLQEKRNGTVSLLWKQMEAEGYYTLRDGNRVVFYPGKRHRGARPGRSYRMLNYAVLMAEERRLLNAPDNK